MDRGLFENVTPNQEMFSLQQTVAFDTIFKHSKKVPVPHHN